MQLNRTNKHVNQISLVFMQHSIIESLSWADCISRVTVGHLTEIFKASQ